MSSPFFDRREVLRIGGLSMFGSLGGVAREAQAVTRDVAANAASTDTSCIFILLQGGPSHIDLWDPKPDAPQEIRGPYQAIETVAPGIRFGSPMHHTAKVADRLAVIRSMTHKFTNHIAGTYITLTGSENQQDRDREAHADDFPGPGAILNHIQDGPTRVPVSVSLPNWLSIPGPSNRMPGQYGGFLGAAADPLLIKGEPHRKDYDPLSVKLTHGMTTGRLDDRIGLLNELDVMARNLEKDLNRRHNRLQQSAYDLVVDGRVREALDLSKESDATRDRFGRNRFGQSLLLARRLVEAGIRFVSYNAFNQEWDTHGNLFNRYKQIVPPMDQGFAALIADLSDRGMLDKTMVVNAGEFGRTPVINNQAGRDHWPNAYSTVVAGGGVTGGQLIGSSDWEGGEVASDPVSPADLLATIWNHMGVSPTTEIRDRLNRPFTISNGSIIRNLYH